MFCGKEPPPPKKRKRKAKTKTNLGKTVQNTKQKDNILVKSLDFT